MDESTHPTNNPAWRGLAFVALIAIEVGAFVVYSKMPQARKESRFHQ